MGESNTSRRPLLSVVIAARNDNYGGRGLWRLETVLNCLAESASKANRLSDIEVIVVDWGSDVPLGDATTLTSAAKSVVKWLVVPPDVAGKLQGDSEFPIVLAQNVGIRRARGTFIAQMDADILLSKGFVAKLFDLIDCRLELGAPVEKSLIVSQKRELPWALSVVQAPFAYMLGVGRAFEPLLTRIAVPGHPYTGTGFIMMHRDLWSEIGGFDESLLYRARMELDLGIRVTQRYPYLLLNKAGMHAFHICHHSWLNAIFDPPRKMNSGTKPIAQTVNPNGPDWGLAHLQLSDARREANGEDRAAKQPVRNFGTKIVSLAGVLCALGFILVGAANRATVPYRVRLMPRRAVLALGKLRFLLVGQPVSRWPAIFASFCRQRRAAHHG